MNIGFIKSFYHYAAWILLLQLINISIDPPSMMQTKRAVSSYANKPSVNIIESVYELIAETVFGNEIAESPDDDDIESSSPIFDVYCFHRALRVNTVVNLQIEYDSYYPVNLSFDSGEPNALPPEQL